MLGHDAAVSGGKSWSATQGMMQSDGRGVGVLFSFRKWYSSTGFEG
jgi:hypothetical protein